MHCCMTRATTTRLLAGMTPPGGGPLALAGGESVNSRPMDTRLSHDER